MDDFVWYCFLAACVAMAFCFVWGALVYGLTQDHRHEGSERSEFEIPPVGRKRTMACVGMAIVAMVYLVTTGAFDAVFYGTATLGFVLGASACWSFGNALGASFYAPDVWRIQRVKTSGQALVFVGAVFVLQQVLDFI